MFNDDGMNIVIFMRNQLQFQIRLLRDPSASIIHRPFSKRAGRGIGKLMLKQSKRSK